MARCVLDSCSCVLVLVSLTRAALFTGTTHTCLPGINFHACVYTQVCTKARTHACTHTLAHVYTHACLLPLTAAISVYACMCTPNWGVGLDWCTLNRVLGAILHEYTVKYMYGRSQHGTTHPHTLTLYSSHPRTLTPSHVVASHPRTLTPSHVVASHPHM